MLLFDNMSIVVFINEKCSFIHSFVGRLNTIYIVKSCFVVFTFLTRIQLNDLSWCKTEGHRERRRERKNLDLFLDRDCRLMLNAGYSITVNFYITRRSPPPPPSLKNRLAKWTQHVHTYSKEILFHNSVNFFFFNFTLSVSHFFFSSFKLHFVFHSPRNVLFLDTFRMYVFIWRNFALSTLVDFWVEFSLQTSLFNLLAYLLSILLQPTITSDRFACGVAALAALFLFLRY